MIGGTPWYPHQTAVNYQRVTNFQMRWQDHTIWLNKEWKATQLSPPQISSHFSIWGYSRLHPVASNHARHAQSQPPNDLEIFKLQISYIFICSNLNLTIPNPLIHLDPCISPRASRASRNKRRPLSPERCRGEWPETNNGKIISVMPLKTMIRSNQFHHTTWMERVADMETCWNPIWLIPNGGQPTKLYIV